jgi:hypothetical protein
MHAHEEPVRPPEDRSAAVPAGNPAKRRRPAPVTILAVIELLSAFGYLLTLLFVLGVSGIKLDDLRLNSIAMIEENLVASGFTIGVVVALGLLALASSILLFRMRQFGWTLTMLVTGLSLSSQIWLYYTAGTIVPITMIIAVITVLYLNQREVRTAFGIGRPAEMSSPEFEERA